LKRGKGEWPLIEERREKRGRGGPRNSLLELFPPWGEKKKSHRLSLDEKGKGGKKEKKKKIGVSAKERPLAFVGFAFPWKGGEKGGRRNYSRGGGGGRGRIGRAASPAPRRAASKGKEKRIFHCQERGRRGKRWVPLQHRPTTQGKKKKKESLVFFWRKKKALGRNLNPAFSARV